MSNSQNTENEQQNNLCTTLTEQWKKGELESGWYYVKGADGLIGMMSDYALYRVNLEHPDNEITLLAKMPSYDDWVYLHKARNDAHEIAESLTQENKQLRKWCEEFNALDVAKENQQLKELLKQCRCFFVEGTKCDLVSYHKNDLFMMLEKIDNAIGEKK